MSIMEIRSLYELACERTELAPSAPSRPSRCCAMNHHTCSFLPKSKNSTRSLEVLEVVHKNMHVHSCVNCRILYRYFVTCECRSPSTMVLVTYVPATIRTKFSALNFGVSSPSCGKSLHLFSFIFFHPPSSPLLPL